MIKYHCRNNLLVLSFIILEMLNSYDIIVISVTTLGRKAEAKKTSINLN